MATEIILPAAHHKHNAEE